MKKKLIVIIITFFILQNLFCHNTPVHNSEIETVLFGNSLWQIENVNVEKVKILEAAVYLAVDYFDAPQNEDAGNRALKTLGLQNGIKLKDIATPLKDHEKYTHLGWDNIWYQGTPKKQREKWFFRRDKILRDSIIQICGNNNSSKDKKIALAKLCYYIHIIGDHEGNKPGSAADRMRLVSRPNVKKENCIIDELLLVIPVLFKEQDYFPLTNSLQRIKNQAGQINDSDVKNTEKIKSIAKDVLTELAKYVPKLLENESFFSNSFYIEKIEVDWDLYYKNAA